VIGSVTKGNGNQGGSKFPSACDGAVNWEPLGVGAAVKDEIHVLN
jgi:hypothetical protein